MKMKIAAKVLPTVEGRALAAFVTSARNSQLHCFHPQIPSLLCRVKSLIAKPPCHFSGPCCFLVHARILSMFSSVQISTLFLYEDHTHHPECPPSDSLLVSHWPCLTRHSLWEGAGQGEGRATGGPEEGASRAASPWVKPFCGGSSALRPGLFPSHTVSLAQETNQRLPLLTAWPPC